MKPDDIAVGFGGGTAPLWLPMVNQYVALILGVLSIAYVMMKLWRAWKGR